MIHHSSNKYNTTLTEDGGTSTCSRSNNSGKTKNSDANKEEPHIVTEYQVHTEAATHRCCLLLLLFTKYSSICMTCCVSPVKRLSGLCVRAPVCLLCVLHTFYLLCATEQPEATPYHASERTDIYIYIYYRAGQSSKVTAAVITTERY